MTLLNVFLFLGVFILISIPMGKHISNLVLHKKTVFDKAFTPMDDLIYKTFGCKCEEMSCGEYIKAFVYSNLFMFILTYILLWIDGSHHSLSFNTAVSFLTNTNLQHYSGEWLNGLPSRFALINLMFTSAASGLAVCLAIIRGIIGKPIGNFFEDLVTSITRVLLPISIIVAIALVVLGVPQTLETQKIVETVEGKYQILALGPAACWEAIKHLGTNGGGLFSANSSYPFENPNLYTNYIEMMCMMLVPGGIVVAFGYAMKNVKQGWYVFITLLALFLLSFAVIFHFEGLSSPILKDLGISGINLEGKEVRFGLVGSALFTDVTTSFTTGSVNNMHDSLTPLAGMMPLWNMCLNCIFGGKGVGFMNVIMYMMLSVFLCGLMVGRTPEFFGKKLEGKEMKVITFLILLHPLIILLPSAISLIFKGGLDGITNPQFHGISQILYEYASSAANNGSGFEGLADGTTYWNIFTGIVMLLGRYISMVLMIDVAVSMLNKQRVPETTSTFKTDNIIFSVILFAIIIIIGALTFLPAFALGPIAEHLTIWG